MSDLQSTVDTIDRVLAECDASTLRPLEHVPTEPVGITAPTAEQFADGLRVLRTLGQPINHPVPEPPAQDPTRGWLTRWIRRNRR